MLRVGLTGGIGSGKSTAGRFFVELGVPVIDADQVARDLVEPGSSALMAIKARFGDSIVTNDGRLDRARLRDKVFTDAAAREDLEAILHPAIRQELRRRVTTLDGPYCIIAIPLLLEKGWETEVDRILVIDADPERQLARTENRDGVTRSAAEAILKTQVSREVRLARADDVIHNDGDLASLREQVTMAHQHYVALAAAG